MEEQVDLVQIGLVRNVLQFEEVCSSGLRIWWPLASFKAIHSPRWSFFSFLYTRQKPRSLQLFTIFSNCRDILSVCSFPIRARTSFCLIIYISSLTFFRASSCSCSKAFLSSLFCLVKYYSERTTLFWETMLLIL